MAKIYGITTTINLEELDNLTEEEVFEKIYRLQTLIDFGMTNDHNFKEYGLDKDYLENAIYNLDYLTYYTRIFGVKFDTLPEEGKRIKLSDSYLNWYYMHYEKHFGFDKNNPKLKTKE